MMVVKGEFVALLAAVWMVDVLVGRLGSVAGATDVMYGTVEDFEAELAAHLSRPVPRR